jgi:ATP-dependent Clp protease adapter protein ClpS
MTNKTDKKYETKLMYKVYTSGLKIILFETKEEAEEYISFCESVGKTASLNKWTWETLIEE